MRSRKVATTKLVDRKKLRKVKKNWVTVSLISFSILGAGGLTVADHYASADGENQSSTSSSSNININAVPASVDTVSASVSQAGAAVKNPGSAQIYNINLTNNNPYGAIIPKGTVIKITFNSPAGTDLSKELSFSGLNAAGALANNYSANFSGNTLTITTTADQYPSSQNLQAIFNLSDPGWNWDNSNNEETPNNFNITANAEFIYQGNSLTSNFNASNLNFAIAPTPKATAEKLNTDNPTPGYQQGLRILGFQP
ncbi:KxYKxGKxW signal peptide containing protein [Fructobacillus pseudoficulneus]|nr:KxYKxGKxW signal peptide domain-containing protein [Fructobacillus pseudoficulneus]SEH36041.1 KxYKxGKxW signal peptide containing protein [Fructobacillus pseudoficulneus]